MSHKLKPGNFAVVIEGKKEPDLGPGFVRKCPSKSAKKEGQIDVGGVLVILDPRPEWTKGYPYGDAAKDSQRLVHSRRFVMSAIDAVPAH